MSKNAAVSIALDSAGVELGVQSTPTFFVGGEQLQLESCDDLGNAIEAALAE